MITSIITALALLQGSNFLVMASKSNYPGKSSPGILLPNPQTDILKYRDKKVQLYIRESNKNSNLRQAEDEDRRFEDLKKLYLDKCAPINKQVVQSLSRKSANPHKAHIFKTSQVNHAALNELKFGKKEGAPDRKLRRNVLRKAVARVSCVEKPGKGCGIGGCVCVTCTCVNCRVDCQCMRRK